ncbi:unnamed protein product [Ascophyllum nodosum]
MVQFGATLLESRRREWSAFYLDYNGLKAQLRQLKDAYNAASAPAVQIHEGNRNSTSSAAWPVPSSGEPREGVTPEPSKTLRRMFTSCSLTVGSDVDDLESKFSKTLDSEIEKIVLFFLSKEGELAGDLLSSRREQRKWMAYESTWRGGTGEDMAEEGGDDRSISYCSSPGITQHTVYCAIGREIAELMRFLHLNVTGLRKILKKHDKQLRDKLIATNYLSTRAKAKYSSMRQLYNNEGIMALVASLRNAFEEPQLEDPLATDDAFLQLMESTALFDEETDDRRLSFQSDVSAAGSHIDDGASLRRAGFSYRNPHKSSAAANVLDEIAEVQRELAKEQHMTISRYLSLQVLLDGSGLASLDDVAEIDEKRDLHPTSAFINLATTFAYTTNYYIVGPTSAEYAAALGGSPAVSGLIIGMTPIAACVSCLFYSWWTNRSFRQPLLLCSVMLIIGNLLYGLALTFDAFWMVLLGRALVGLGGARGINRRYIADTIPMKSRTAYSTAFVAVSAAGMAVGPFVATMTNSVGFRVVGVRFNGLTNPGWIMFVLWIVIGIVVFLGFQEPPHSYSSVDSDEDTPGSTLQPYTRTSSKSLAVWDANAAAASPALNTNDGGEYGSTAAPITSRDGLDASSEEDIGTGEGAAARDLQTTSGAVEESGGTAKCGGTCLGNITYPLRVCLFGCFVNKLVTEAVVSSSPVLTQQIFNWSAANVGWMMSILGLLVLPVNATVGHLSLVVEDRALLQVLFVFAGVGCVVAMNFPGLPFEYTDWQYMAGVGLTFLAMQAQEGVVMSITSKVIPDRLASGTWNSGFLTTEAGTFGRFVGNVLITTMGMLTLSSLDILLFTSLTALLGMMAMSFSAVYPLLQGD